MIIHKTTYKCDICGKESEVSWDIDGKIRIIHGGDDIYDNEGINYEEVCPECINKVMGCIKDLKDNLRSDKPKTIEEEIEANKEELDKVLSFD